VLQNSLTNIARHGQSTRVDISFKVDPEQAKFLLEVRHNVRGISPVEMHKRNPFGLIGMCERVPSKKESTIAVAYFVIGN
jgi:signal transduction histidine kinase